MRTINVPSTMTSFRSPAIILIGLLFLTACSEGEEYGITSSKERTTESGPEKNSPKNWAELKAAIVHGEAENLRALTPDKINDERFETLTARLFKEDVQQEMSKIKFDELTPIGQDGDEIYAFYVGGETKRGEFTYKHAVEVYFKLLPDGLCLWNFMIAE